MIVILTVQAVHAESENYEFEPSDLTDALDGEAKNCLPDSYDNETLLKAGADMFILSIRYFIKSFFENVLLLSGIVIIAAIVSKIGESLSFRYASDIIVIAQILPVALSSYHVISALFDSMNEYISQINGLLSSYGVVMSEVYLLGGNISSAAVSSAWLGFALELSRNVCMSALIPLIKICFSVTLASSVSQSVNLQAIARFMRNIYVTASVLFMTVITVIMNFQITVASSQDSIAMRSMRYAASNSIPIIGSLFSESLKTLSTGISLTKSYSGLVCVTCLLAVSALPAAKVFASKYTFSLSASFAEFLDVPSAVNILSDCGKLLNYMIGIIVITDVYFIYFVTVFTKSVSAIG